MPLEDAQAGRERAAWPEQPRGSASVLRPVSLPCQRDLARAHPTWPAQTESVSLTFHEDGR